MFSQTTTVIRQFTLTMLLAFAGLLLLPSSAVARPGHHFKELILHERVVPFDDSMPGEDYYEDAIDGDETGGLHIPAAEAATHPTTVNHATKSATEARPSSSSSASDKKVITTSASATERSSTAVESVNEDAKTTSKHFKKTDDDDEDDDDDDVDDKEEDDDDDKEEEDDDDDVAGKAASDDVNGTDQSDEADDDDDDDDDDDEAFDDIPKFHDPCQYVYCRMGRVCKSGASGGRGKCVCADANHCHGSSRKVCGTDGQFYPSHCELHRSACLKGVHISTDHSAKSCSGEIGSNHSSAATSSSPLKVVSRASEGDVGDAKETSGRKSKTADRKSETSEHKSETSEHKSETSDRKSETSEHKSGTSEHKSETAAAVVGTLCTKLGLKQMIDGLVDYHCSRLGKNFNCSDVHNKRIVVGNILSYYDRNRDKSLDASELSDAELSDQLKKKLSMTCRFIDMLHFNDDSDLDGQLSITEFFSAFGVSMASLDDTLKVYTTSVTVGNSVELKCDVKGLDRIIWKRKGHAIEGTVDKQIKVFDDGSLYIGDLRLDHMGNYTCQDRLSNDVIQTHILLVQTLPQVQVHPSAQIHLSGSTVTLKCRADGVPRPEVTWEKNEWPLQASTDSLQRYLFLHNNTILEIKSADYKSDTGAYKCKAKNSAGTSDQVAAVFVENGETSKHSSYLRQNELFSVFHDHGYTVYEVGHCHTEHQVAADFRGFRVSPGQRSTPDTLCQANETCSWSDAVVVKNKFIYIAQPKLNRVVVIEMDRSNPIEVILMDKSPIKLDYVEHLDEVWVTCAMNEDSNHQLDRSKVIVIVRQASSDHPHFGSHTQLTEDGLGDVTGVFLPLSNSLKHNFEYGYVTRGDKMALHKLHLASVMYAKEVSLSEYGCLPRSIHFIPIGGMVLVGCVTKDSEEKPSFHLLLDYITDGLLERLEVNGDGYLSPDSRRIVIVGDHGNTVFVFKATDDGVLQHVFDEYTQLHLDDVAFFPSESGFDYDAFITSADQPSILHLDLESGRVSITEGLGEALPASRWPRSKHSRIIVSGGPFDEHLMTTSDKSAIVIDGRRRRMQCEWRDVVYGNVIVPLPEILRD